MIKYTPMFNIPSNNATPSDNYSISSIILSGLMVENHVSNTFRAYKGLSMFNNGLALF